MTAHMVFAIIYLGEVKNTIVGDYYNCNEIAKAEYGDNAFAVEITQIPAAIGDKYINGTFQRLNESGQYTAIDPVPTEAQQIETLTQENASLREYVNDISLTLTAFIEESEAV